MKHDIIWNTNFILEYLFNNYKKIIKNPIEIIRKSLYIVFYSYMLRFIYSTILFTHVFDFDNSKLS